MVLIKGLQKTTLLDYPGKLACTVFLAGCNLRCGYCYNSDLAIRHHKIPTISQEHFFDFLKSKKQILEGVAITGGEPTIHPDLPEFAHKIKELGFSLKLDTNGTNPSMVESMLNQGLIDYIAMDIKSCPREYSMVCGVDVSLRDIRRTVDIIKNSHIDHEFRTTVIPDMISDEHIRQIADLVAGAKKFAIQQFMANSKTIDAKYRTMDSVRESELHSFAEILTPYVGEVVVRK